MIPGKATTVLTSRLARRKLPSIASSILAKRPGIVMATAGNRSMASHVQPALGFRYLSSEIRAQTAAAAAANASMAAEAAGNGTNKKKTAESNLFLDNLGKIFLIGIGSVIVTLVRSSYNTSNRHLIRDRLEEIAAIDPKEIEEFREANSELTLDVLRQILRFYYTEEIQSIDASGVTTTSYEDFVTAIRKIMATKFPKEGESFTIQTGHYLDRMVVAALQERGEGAPHVAESAQKSNNLPAALLFAAMASAMNGSVSDRIRILHEILVVEEEIQKQQQEQMGMISSKNSAGASAAADSVPLARVRDMVGYLQETCQLPPDTQIVPTDRKYPTQLWRRATPMDMVPDTENETNDIDLVEFAAILRTKSVCAWGECYMKWMPDASEFEAPPQTQTTDGSLTS